MKRFVFLSLSLLLLLILIPGCFTFTNPAPNTPPDGQPSIIIVNPNSNKGSETLLVGTPSVIGTFNSNPSTINSGGTSTLVWNVTGATSVSIDQGIGQVDVTGTRVVSPRASTVYTISATNSAGTVTRSFLTTVNSASPSPMGFSVTGATANTEPSGSGCFTLYANITANGSGSATYIWESTEGGGYSYTWNVTFPTAGTQRVTLPVEMSALPSGQYRVHVLTPNDLASNSTYYTTCGDLSTPISTYTWGN